MSFHVVYFILFVSVGISFCLDVRPMLGWKASGVILWKGRVLSGGGLLGLRVWGFMAGFSRASKILLGDMLCSSFRWLFLENYA